MALADKCLNASGGVLAMVNPTVSLTTPSGQRERQVLAKRFHIHTLLTCHQPGEINLSQNTSINESLIVARRYEPREGTKPPTRIISLDRMPTDDGAVAELQDRLVGCERGLLSDGWGEVSEWPVERIEAGDWTAGVFRAPELAEAAFDLATHKSLFRMEDQNMVPSAVLLGGGRGYERRVDTNAPGIFPVLYSKSAEAQLAIRGLPDQHWAPKKSVPRRQWVDVPGADGRQHPDTARLMNQRLPSVGDKRAGHRHRPPDGRRTGGAVCRLRLAAGAGGHAGTGEGRGCLPQLDCGASAIATQSRKEAGVSTIQSCGPESHPIARSLRQGHG